jgi:hypothetical protein
MLEDVCECWREVVTRVRFRFVLASSTVAETCVPLVTGDRFSLDISIPLSAQVLIISLCLIWLFFFSTSRRDYPLRRRRANGFRFVPFYGTLVLTTRRHYPIHWAILHSKLILIDLLLPPLTPMWARMRRPSMDL